jgi:hypothetical protein
LLSARFVTRAAALLRAVRIMTIITPNITLTIAATITQKR